MGNTTIARAPITAPRGAQLTCKNWQIEAPYRMIQHNLEIAAEPEELIVYGGRGKAARNWDCYDAILKALEEMEPDETLLVQSGKPVGVIRTHLDAPRVLLANSNLVPQWATWDHFNKLEDAKVGLMMYGQMTAGSWIYIGSQGILQGTYETLRTIAQQQLGASDLRGKFVLTAGLGQMGGAQPKAITLLGGVGLIAEMDPERAARCKRNRYLDEWVESLDEGIDLVHQALRDKRPLSVGVLGNAAEIYWNVLQKGIVPDIVTDQTPAHDPIKYVPLGMTIAQATRMAEVDKEELTTLARQSMARHVEAMLAFKTCGSFVFEYGNNLRKGAEEGGVTDAFSFQGQGPYIRHLFCQGKGPFRWVALSGEPEDIYRTDAAILELFPGDQHLHDWISRVTRSQEFEFEGLPSRICWLGYGDRAAAGLKFNDMVARGELLAPVVIGRDHLDGGSVASPYRETEGMKDGSDAVADWPLLNALLNTAMGATWVSIHQGGGVGMGLSIHAGQVIVADGTPEAAVRLGRVLTADPWTAIIRHVDSGEEHAIQVARDQGLKIPMLPD